MIDHHVTHIARFTWLNRQAVLVFLCLAIVTTTTIPAAIGGVQPKTRNALQETQKLHRERYREFEKQIEKLAKECKDKGLDEESETILSRAFVPSSDDLRVTSLPDKAQSPIPAHTEGMERSWRQRLRTLESGYGNDLYLQSKRAVKVGCTSYAYDLIREAALHEPDHKQVRKILGFERIQEDWVTQTAADLMINRKLVWNKKFGWLPKEHIQKYLEGQRYLNGNWVGKEKEAEQRRDFNKAWEIRTDHYLVKTNVSLESGVELGRALEDFHRVFKETFAGFFNTPEQLKRLLENPTKPGRRDTGFYIVHYYRTREEYVDRLRKHFPSIDQTNGVYLTTDKVAHFYHDPKQDRDGTLFHEATHQLFFESHRDDRKICENHHFWIIEGIACYMESFQRKKSDPEIEDPDIFSLGDPKYVRFVGARDNLINKKYYVPLREFSGFGMHEFQGAAELAKNYTQASGLARFFMHHEDGRYREALVTHLTQLYSSDPRVRENAQGLDELTGIDFEILDRQYAEDARAVE